MKKFEQMKRQYASLRGYLDETDLSDKNISATTADFDRLFELAWKTMKVYLYEDLAIYEAKTASPREILKLAAAQEPLYELVEEIRKKYGCQTDAQVFACWERYKKENK